mgnify:CR=1 FL=1
MAKITVPVLIIGRFPFGVYLGFGFPLFRRFRRALLLKGVYRIKQLPAPQRQNVNDRVKTYHAAE